MLIALINIVILLLKLLSWVIIGQAILSWLIAFNVVNTGSAFVRSLYTAFDWITRPIYRPIRRVLPDFGAIDFSPLVALLAILVLQELLGGLAMDVAFS
jgi:YggT family protein